MLTRISQAQNRTVIVDRQAPPADYNALKARQEELSNQLQSVQERREELAQQLNAKTGVDRAGIESRMTILDQRLAQLENDLSKVGTEVALAAPGSLVEPNVIERWRGFDEEDMWGAGFAGAMLAFALCVPLFIRTFRRRKFVPPGATLPMIGGERIDRMEQAIDSIAVEIERVSENQRFMTRLMTETQLAGSIAAVRGSTEVAKAAAEALKND